MNDSRNKTTKVRMDSETAIAFASNEFEKLHPRETWPEWLRPCTVIDYHRDQQKRFVVSFSVTIAEPLQADEHWEEIDGRKQIVKVIPGNSERLIVISPPARAKYIFGPSLIQKRRRSLLPLMETFQ